MVARMGSDLLARARAWREDLHRLAEPSFGERRTGAYLAEQLARMPLDGLRTGVAGHGLVAWIGSGPRTVALRAEMDALPLQEQTGLPFASSRPGQMHACGHDGHMAVLLGLAEWFSARRDRLPGTIKLLFQPAEEEGAGAREMVAAGALRDPAVDAILAIHGRPQVGPGQIDLVEVPSAAADAFDVTIEGASAHGAYPHQGRDALWIASQVVCALQQVVARRVPAQRAAVVSVGAMVAGTARNVVAEQARLQGTIRTRQPEVRRQVLEAVERLVLGTASALGGTARFELRVGYPRVVNDPWLTRLVGRIGEQLLGAENVLHSEEATMGADDFSYYLSEQGGVPGCMIRLGLETDQMLHTNRFDFGHRALGPAMELLAGVCLAFLEEEAQG